MRIASSAPGRSAPASARVWRPAGSEVTLVDAWAAHVEAIRAHGLRALGVPRPVELRLPATLPEDAPGGQDLALVTVDANNTAGRGTDRGAACCAPTAWR